MITKKLLGLMVASIIVVMSFVACADKDLKTNMFETGLIDQSGNVVGGTLISTNVFWVTNEIDMWVTNIVDESGKPPSVTVTNNVTNIVWVTNATVPNLPTDPSAMYRLYVPWAGKGDGYYTVNYKDTAKLKQLWLDQVQRKGVGDGKVFAIKNRANNRDANNFQKVHKDGNFEAADYYYFNANGDIVYKPDNAVIKRFKGAVIVTKRNNTKRQFGSGGNWGGVVKYTWEDTGVYTVGAIYEMAIGTADAKAKYGWDATGKDPFKDGVYDFIAARMQLETFNNGVVWANNLFERQYTEGFIEVLVMNPEENEGRKDNSAAVHSYYAYYGVFNVTGPYDGCPGFTEQNVPFMTDPNKYLGERPEYVVPLLTHSTRFTDNNRSWNYLFIPGTPDGIGR